MDKGANLLGARFGLLRVTRALPPYIRKQRPNQQINKWLCVCTCGATREVRADTLVAGKVTGCLSCKANARTHGMTNTPTWITYRGMLARCYDPNSPKYHEYGGAGIRVCPKWLGKGGFERFLADMGERPDGMTLDRRKGHLGYTPKNCRWATLSEQNRNRNIALAPVKYQGRSQPLLDWATEIGLDYNVLRHRLNKLGWSVQRAFTTPVRSLKRAK